MAKASDIKTEKAKISAAFLRLVARKGWDGVTVVAVAKQAGISPASFKKRFAEPVEIIPLVVDGVTREALAASEAPAGNPHDALFDLMMARFDVLQKNRKAILALADAARRDRPLAIALGRSVWEAIHTTIDAAEINAPSRSLSALGLTAVYGWAFWTWRQDKTRDMSKTMAALDRALKLALGPGKPAPSICLPCGRGR